MIVIQHLDRTISLYANESTDSIDWFSLAKGGQVNALGNKEAFLEVHAWSQHPEQKVKVQADGTIKLLDAEGAEAKVFTAVVLIPAQFEIQEEPVEVKPAVEPESEPVEEKL